MILSAVLSAILQLAVFSLVPFVVHLVKERKARGFFRYVGLFAPPRAAFIPALLIAVLLCSSTMLLVVSLGQEGLALAAGSVAGKLNAIESKVVYAVSLLFSIVVQTSLSEEIFFRGFVAKRMMARWGPVVGNLVHAALFAAIHIVIVILLVGAKQLLLALAIGALVGAGAYALAWVMDRYAEGSIVPAWFSHAIANLASVLAVAYSH